MKMTDRLRRMLCIKYYRDAYGLTLRQATEYVEIHINWRDFIPHI